jgi:hypothetical protein
MMIWRPHNPHHTPPHTITLTVFVGKVQVKIEHTVCPCMQQLVNENATLAASLRADAVVITNLQQEQQALEALTLALNTESDEHAAFFAVRL